MNVYNSNYIVCLIASPRHPVKNMFTVTDYNYAIFFTFMKLNFYKSIQRNSSWEAAEYFSVLFCVSNFNCNRVESSNTTDR
jgi:hypothetical protein